MNNKQQATDQEQYQPDFDELLNLAKGDPELFEAKRLEYIEFFFNKVPTEKQRRLRGLQWQIDQARYLARNPLSSCMNLMNMMWDSLSQLNDKQQNLVQLTNAASQGPKTYPAITPDAPSESCIIPFPAR